MLAVLAVTVACVGLAAASASTPPLNTVAHVDLARYSGKWYEIARYPNRFERKCDRDVTAEYAPKPNGDISVTNTCTEKDGKTTASHGTAVVTDPASNARLKVTFFWPFYGKYWIIDLDPQYRFAVVGEPDRDYLWILSRTPSLDRSTYDEILLRIADHGYDTSKLVTTTQTQK